MEAIKDYFEDGEASIQAVLSGNDMIISSNFVEQKQAILNAVKENRISEEQINKVVKKILACKYMYRIM